VTILQDARVRYYALEALFNIAKVTREGFMPFFADTFEALFRLSADMDSAVHQATTYLDNLLKVPPSHPHLLQYRKLRGTGKPLLPFPDNFGGEMNMAVLPHVSCEITTRE